MSGEGMADLVEFEMMQIAQTPISNIFQFPEMMPFPEGEPYSGDIDQARVVGLFVWKLDGLPYFWLEGPAGRGWIMAMERGVIQKAIEEGWAFWLPALIELQWKEHKRLGLNQWAWYESQTAPPKPWYEVTAEVTSEWASDLYDSTLAPVGEWMSEQSDGLSAWADEQAKIISETTADIGRGVAIGVGLAALGLAISFWRGRK